MTTDSKLPSIVNALLILVVLLPGLLGHDYPEPLRSYFLLAGIMLIGILTTYENITRRRRARAQSREARREYRRPM